MSDDAFLGTACCRIPRRFFGLLVGLGFILYGIFVGFFMLIENVLPGLMTSKSTFHCSGPGCMDIVTCAGMQNTTFEVRRVCLVLGGLFFGTLGVVGAIHRNADKLNYFAMYLAALAVLAPAMIIGDTTYTWVCNSFPYNVIDLALLWPIPNIPLMDGYKAEFRTLPSYPVEVVNALATRSTWKTYWPIVLPMVLFFASAAHEIFVLADRIENGAHGLGANFSIRTWRENVIRQYFLREYVKESMNMAQRSAADFEWSQETMSLLANQPYGERRVPSRPCESRDIAERILHQQAGPGLHQGAWRNPRL